MEHKRKQVVGGLEVLSRRVRREVERQLSGREHVLFCLRGSLGHSPSEPAPPLIANLERIASLRQSGALSEPEYERLKGVLLAAADGGMTFVAPRIYTDSS